MCQKWDSETARLMLAFILFLCCWATARELTGCVVERMERHVFVFDARAGLDSTTIEAEDLT